MNSRRLGLVYLALLFGASVVFADTIPGGNVSGTWYRSHSPYYIAGYITVPAGDTLTIEPGVRVEFLSNFGLTVNGWLEAVGTEADSIRFTSPDDGGGIVLDSAPDSSRFVYCTINRLQIPLRCINSSPVVAHCLISDAENALMVSGYGSPRISDCIISDADIGIQWQGEDSVGGTISRSIIKHHSVHGVVVTGMPLLTFIDCVIDSNGGMYVDGAGVRAVSADVAFMNCAIFDNFAYGGSGGGVYCHNGTATFTNCAISGNKAANLGSASAVGGGGVYLHDASATFSCCTITDNWGEGGTTGWAAGAIAFGGDSLNIDHCTIDRNQTWGRPAPCMAILSPGGAVAITNSIVSGHSDSAIYSPGTITVEYSDFADNLSPAIYGAVPAGFGVLDTVNRNGDSCDRYYNILLDPMYADPEDGDFHLTEGSPCIDAGDPESPPDPDSTCADMGAYFYNQGPGVEENPESRTTSPMPAPTIARGCLFLPQSLTPHPQSGACLLDISGRKVMGLQPGANDLGRLAPGVYFVLQQPTALSRGLRVPRKVVVTR